MKKLNMSYIREKSLNLRSMKRLKWMQDNKTKKSPRRNVSEMSDHQKRKKRKCWHELAIKHRGKK